MDRGVAFARARLLPFCIGINPKYETAMHVRMIARKLEELEARKIKRLMVFMPPRHGKSYLISQYFPAWYLGRNPNHQVIFTSYSQEVASDFGRKVRNQMSEEIYQGVFDTRIAADSSAAHRFNVGQSGAYYAVGAGGPLTSRGGDLIIIDDIHKNRQEASSATIRKTIHEWYGSTLYTRLMPNAVMILVQTRWHEDDLPGRLIKEASEPWETLKLPAISDTGHALWPERYSIERLEGIKKTLGSREFQALYQQEPSSEEGAIIKRTWIKRYTTPPEKLDEQIISLDATFTGKSTSDYVAIQVWGRFGARKFLMHRVKKQLGITDTIRELLLISELFPKAALKLVENKANGPAIEDLLKLKVSGIVLWEPEGDKVARANAVSPQFEAGNVFIPEGPGYDEYIDELCTFPNAPNDDETDATTMALLRLESSVSRGVGVMRVLR